MKNKLIFFLILILVISCESKHQEQSPKTLVIVLDGMRPDYISEEVTPFLYRMKQEGVSGEDHHSTFPSVTRVNSSSYATGSYPFSHGLLGNQIHIPATVGSAVINTGDADALMALNQQLSGEILTTTSFGEILEAKGMTYMVFSSGSTGQSFLLNHKVKGGGIVNPDLILPEEMRQDWIDLLGEIPEKSTPNLARHKWILEAYKSVAFEEDGPDVSTIWLSDPDGTAHAHGVGAPETLEAMRYLDGLIESLWEFVEVSGERDRFNLMVTADHGFVSHEGNPGLKGWLDDNGFQAVVAGGAVYLENKDQKEALVLQLQQESWVGALFSSALQNDALKGEIPGTLSFEAIQWGHQDRKADILVDMNWSDEANEFGFRGYSTNNGVAGHGTSSPYEMHPPFIAKGPKFKQGFVNNAPTGIADILPTVLYIHGVEIPGNENRGRIMHEILKGNDTPDSKVLTDTVWVETEQEWGTYKLGLVRKSIGQHHYMDHTITQRINRP